MKQLMLVDSEQNFRMSASYLLTQAGYQVTEAASAREALRMIFDHYRRGGRYDLVITELRLPWVPGETLLRQLRENLFRFPILIITALPSATTMQRIEKLHSLHLLVKPFSPKTFLQRIADLTCTAAHDDVISHSGDVVSKAAGLSEADPLVS